MRMLLPRIRQLADQYHSDVQFLFVYILEAHAADEWPIGELEPEIPQHRTVQDRLQAAASFLAKHPLPASVLLAVDNEANDFVDLYCSWPFRYWVVDQGRVALKCMPDGDQVDLVALERWLMAYVDAASC